MNPTKINAAVAAVMSVTKYIDIRYIGKIEATPEGMGHVFCQSIDRQKTIVFHDPAKLDGIPRVGKIEEIHYDENGNGHLLSSRGSGEGAAMAISRDM